MKCGILSSVLWLADALHGDADETDTAACCRRLTLLVAAIICAVEVHAGHGAEANIAIIADRWWQRRVHAAA